MREAKPRTRSSPATPTSRRWPTPSHDLWRPPAAELNGRSVADRCSRDRPPPTPAAATTPSVRGFASDNYAGVHPEVLAAIAARQRRPPGRLRRGRLHRAPAGGLPRATSASGAEAFPVFNGTGANVVALQAMTDRWGAVICAESRAHPRRRVRRAREGRRPQAAHRADPGRQAHPRADRPAGVRLRTTSTAPSRRSSRSPRAPSSAPATRVEEIRGDLRARARARHGRAPRRRPDRQRGRVARTCRCAPSPPTSASTCSPSAAPRTA